MKKRKERQGGREMKERKRLLDELGKRESRTGIAAEIG